MGGIPAIADFSAAGESLQRAADVIDREHQRFVELDAKEAAIEFNNSAMNALANAMRTQGKDAAGAPAQLQKDMLALQKDISKRLSPEAQRMFSLHSSQAMGDIQRRGNNHSIAETDKWETQLFIQGNEDASKRARMNIDAGVEAWNQTIDAEGQTFGEFQKFGARKGWTEEYTLAMYNQYKAASSADAIQDLLIRSTPDTKTAREMLNRYGSDMKPERRQQLDASITKVEKEQWRENESFERYQGANGNLEQAFAEIDQEVKDEKMTADQANSVKTGMLDLQRKNQEVQNYELSEVSALADHGFATGMSRKEIEKTLETKYGPLTQKQLATIDNFDPKVQYANAVRAAVRSQDAQNFAENRAIIQDLAFQNSPIFAEATAAKSYDDLDTLARKYPSKARFIRAYQNAKFVTKDKKQLTQAETELKAYDEKVKFAKAATSLFKGMPEYSSVAQENSRLPDKKKQYLGNFGSWLESKILAEKEKNPDLSLAEAQALAKEYTRNGLVKRKDANGNQVFSYQLEANGLDGQEDDIDADPARLKWYVGKVDQYFFNAPGYASLSMADKVALAKEFSLVERSKDNDLVLRFWNRMKEKKDSLVGEAGKETPPARQIGEPAPATDVGFGD
jgi:hypothetical protein